MNRQCDNRYLKGLTFWMRLIFLNAFAEILFNLPKGLTRDFKG